MIAPRRLLLCLIFSLATVSVSSATNYFATQSGSGGRTGLSQSDAWAVSDFNGSSTPKGGDTVTFSGTITSTVTPKTSGSGNGASRLTLDFTGATLSAANPRISLSSKSFMNINGGTFASTASGVLITFNRTVCHDITIDGWTFVGPAGGTATFWDAYYPQFVTISNNHIDNVTGLGYSDTSATHDLLITGNYIRTSANTATQTDTVTFGDAYNVTIEKNMLINQSPGQNNNGQHNDVIQTFHSGAGSSANPSGWVVRYNWIQLAMNTPFRTGDNSWMQLESFDNAHGGFGIKIYGNVFVGEGTSFSGNNGFGVDSHGISYTAYVYNNTVIRKNGPDRTIGWVSGGVLNMRNNVGMANSGQSGTFIDISAMTPGPGGYDYDYWYQFGAASSLAGSHGSTSMNPQFMNWGSDDFSLAPASAAVGTADSTIGNEYSQGIAPGATWPNPTLVARPAGAWDPGAFQTNGVAAGPKPNPPQALAAVVQ